MSTVPNAFAASGGLGMRRRAGSPDSFADRLLDAIGHILEAETRLGRLAGASDWFVHGVGRGI